MHLLSMQFLAPGSLQKTCVQPSGCYYVCEQVPGYFLDSAEHFIIKWPVVFQARNKLSQYIYADYFNRFT